MIDTPLPYLQGYPAHLLDQVRRLLAENRLGAVLESRYPGQHAIQSDKALFQFVDAMRQQGLRNTTPLAHVAYDSRIDPVKGLLGSNSFVVRQQGGKLRRHNEIRIATLFRQAPQPFLSMIVAHELAHLRHKDHDKAFYQLCTHLEPDYHQLEFDLRLWLTWQKTCRA